MDTRYPNTYVINVLSDDHPGIIAAVSGAIVELEGNIDACSQTVLGGFFTQILVVSLPKPIDADELAGRVRKCDGRGGLQVVARPYASASAATPDKPAIDKFVITAFGKDRPGIIHRFSQYLAGKDINIVDLYWDRRGDDFVLIAQVEIPERWDTLMLQADLEEIGREQGFTGRMQHENIFVATNQLRFGRQ